MTVEPCLMCVGAIVHARVATVVYGAPTRKGARCAPSSTRPPCPSTTASRRSRASWPTSAVRSCRSSSARAGISTGGPGGAGCPPVGGPARHLRHLPRSLRAVHRHGPWVRIGGCFSHGRARGEVREWLNRAVSKTVVPKRYRGFESHPLRQTDGQATGSERAGFTPGSEEGVWGVRRSIPQDKDGEMREWLNRRDWKSRVGVTPLPRVRIPLSPPAPYSSSRSV